jgi:hypothetical protein
MWPETRRSQAKLAMRAETHKLQHRIIRLPVNQHQVWFDMAVTVVILINGKSMGSDSIDSLTPVIPIYA